MADPITEFRRQSYDAYRAWEGDFIVPYSKAYNLAFRDYEETIKQQKEADKAVQERKLALAMFVLSLTGGSVLTSLFGAATIKHAATTIALDVMARNNMDRAWKVAAFVESSKTAQFALGEAWDGAGGWMSSELKSKLSESAVGAKNACTFVKDPLDLYLSLHGWMLDIHRYVDQAADECTRLELLLTAPYFRSKPKEKADQDKLQTEIELSLLLKYLLDQDYIETVEFEETGIREGFRRKVIGRKPITESPLDKNYPQSTRLTYPAMTQDIVKRDSVGSIIRKKMNELHKKRFGVDFFARGDADVGLSHEDLRRAQVNLSSLANKNYELIEQSAKRR